MPTLNGLKTESQYNRSRLFLGFTVIVYTFNYFSTNGQVCGFTLGGNIIRLMFSNLSKMHFYVDKRLTYIL